MKAMLTRWGTLLHGTPVGQADLDDLESKLFFDREPGRDAYMRFAVLLVLSVIIATGGVLGDSTATVIGAMIVAPLMTPIMATALAMVTGDQRHIGRSLLLVGIGVVTAVALSAIFAWLAPGILDISSNSQVQARIAPRTSDLVVALASGAAGAFALSRRSVADALPGVAIAISLVPPLAVVGICLGQGDLTLALGAFVLFASNLVALVLAGTLVFTAYGYAKESTRAFGFPTRRAYLGIVAGLLVVVLPLAANTVANVLVVVWTHRVSVVAERWVAAQPGASLDGVQAESTTIYVDVRTPAGLPPYEQLLTDLDGQVPDGITVVVRTTMGDSVEIGQVGG